METDKKKPIYTFDIKIKGEKKGQDKKYKIQLKKPTRSMFNEADMFYSIQLNKYIKMGLLTAEQLAKRQIDIGGTFSEEQQKHYAKLQTLIADKEEMFLRLAAKTELSPDEEDRKKSLIEDISVLRSQIIDYEYIRNQVYEHTANSKARNDVILWWVLGITQFAEIDKDGNTGEFRAMFEGDSHETRKMKLEEMEDDEDVVVTNCFSKLVKIVTVWYWMGISDNKKMEEILKMEENA